MTAIDIRVKALELSVKALGLIPKEQFETFLDDLRKQGLTPTQIESVIQFILFNNKNKAVLG